MPRTVLAMLTLVLLGPAPGRCEEHRSSADGTKLHFEVAGRGPAVVLLHGWGHSLDSWQFLLPALSAEYRVIRLDRRGFGKSEGTADTSLDPVDICSLLDSLGIEKAAVVGHSLGAESALRLVRAFPQRLSALVLYGSFPPSGFGLPWSGPDALPSGLAATAREFGLEAMRARLEGHPAYNGFVVGTPGHKLHLAMYEAYPARDLLDPRPPAGATPPADVEHLGEIQVPTLVITGEMEMPYLQIVSDALAYGIRGADRVAVPGGGHCVHLQQPDRFNGEIRRFLASVFH